MEKYQKGQKIIVPYYKTEGYILRKQGAHGYQVTHEKTWTTQDFSTGKFTEHTDYVTNFFRTKDLDELNNND